MADRIIVSGVRAGKGQLLSQLAEADEALLQLARFVRSIYMGGSWVIGDVADMLDALPDRIKARLQD